MFAKFRPLILDRLWGHPESLRHVSNLNLRGTIQGLAQLDGGFVLSHDGIVLSACRFLYAVAARWMCRCDSAVVTVRSPTWVP